MRNNAANSTGYYNKDSGRRSSDKGITPYFPAKDKYIKNANRRHLLKSIDVGRMSDMQESKIDDYEILRPESIGEINIPTNIEL